MSRSRIRNLAAEYLGERAIPYPFKPATEGTICLDEFRDKLMNILQDATDDELDDIARCLEVGDK